MSVLFLELKRTVLFLSSPLAPHSEVSKALSVVRLASQKLLADKHMVTVLPNCALVRRVQRFESLVTDITGLNPLSLSLVCFVPPH